MNRLTRMALTFRGVSVVIGGICVKRVVQDGKIIAILDTWVQAGTALAADLAATGHSVTFRQLDGANDAGLKTSRAEEAAHPIGRKGKADTICGAMVWLAAGGAKPANRAVMAFDDSESPHCPSRPRKTQGKNP